jgi:Tfp pilus assembly protein PilF
MGQIFIKQKKWAKCVDVTGKILEIDEKNVKAMYRKAQGEAQLNNFEEAERLCKRILEIDSTVTEVIFLGWRVLMNLGRCSAGYDIQEAGGQ